jgi:hypothetical protein
MTAPAGAHLVGSVPLGSSEEVFRTAAGVLGDRLRRLPDGETGVRSGWIGWQRKVFAEHDAFTQEPPVEGLYAAMPRFALRPGADAEALTFDRLGYAEAARDSYETFARLKAEGVLPAHLRFQVSLPTALAPVSAFVADRDKAAVETPYEAALLGELAEITVAVPHGELAIQWDVAVEMAILEGVFRAWFDEPEEGIVERLARAAAAVADDVELGFHLCYGDYEHRHFTQPGDAGRLVALANHVSAVSRRAIAWVHMPVPRERTDDAYFAPLRRLRLHPETELYLGLVHHTDGVEGTQRRIDAAQRAVSSFGVATECGFGRRPPETVPDLLRIHREVSAPVA